MHILLYILDALRADHLGCYGYERDTSPHINALARAGAVFENCFTSTTWTRPVAASILTGTYPGVHLTRSRQEIFSTPLPRLPQVLQDGGYKTAAFSTMGNLSSELGFAGGFDLYHDLFRDPDILASRRKLDIAKEGLIHMRASESEIALPRAEDVHSYLFPWLEENRTSDTFSFVWSIETHAPYQAPEAFRRFAALARPGEGERQDLRSAGAADRQRLIDLYDDELYYNDHCIGQIVNHLKRLGIYDDTLLIVTSDHGDAFFEHGVYSHGQAPYDEIIHVPLVIKFPAGQYAGQRTEGLVELIDLFPTILALAELAPDSAARSMVQGFDLLPLIRDNRREVRDFVFSDTQTLNVQNRYLSVRSHQWKYIQLQRPSRDRKTFTATIRHVIERRMLADILRSPRHFLRRYLSQTNEYLFDLKADPAEQHNLVAKHPEVTQQMQEILAGWLEKNVSLAERVGHLPFSHQESESLRQHLEALGYL